MKVCYTENSQQGCAREIFAFDHIGTFAQAKLISLHVRTSKDALVNITDVYPVDLAAKFKRRAIKVI